MASASDPSRRRVNALEVVVTLCLTYTLCIFFMRLWMRRRLYGLDDVIAMVAAVLAIGQFATQYVALANGLGRSSTYLVTDPNLPALNKASLAGVVLFLLTLYVSKCGAIALTSRFAQPGRHMNAVYALLGLTVLLGFVSILVVTIECGMTSAYYWRLAANLGHCSNQYIRWQVATAFDVITEILILALPIDFIWGLRMPRSTKAWVLIAFWIRFPVLALSIARNHYIHTLLSTSDAGLASGNVIIFQEIELTFSLAAATLMTLRPFAKDFNTGFGLGGDTVGNYGASAAHNYNSGFTDSGIGVTKNSHRRPDANTRRSSPRRSSRPRVKDITSSGRLRSFVGSITGDADRPPSVDNVQKQGDSMRLFNLGGANARKDHALEPKESQESILRQQDAQSQQIYKHITFSVQTEPAPEDDLVATDTPYPGPRYGHPVRHDPSK